jgi:chemotaxis protein methyltransferase CheR
MMGEGAVSLETLGRIGRMLSMEMGLKFPDDRLRDLERALKTACRPLGFRDERECFSQLREGDLTREQIELLASHLTIGETYFFREPQSFAALEHEILPALIKARSKSTKILRIWSAGCSSGEEPYSISILLQKLIPDWAEWQITVLATDINPEGLRRAQLGIYRPWSFRGTDEAFRSRFFHPTEEGALEIRPEVRRLVRFSYLNLADGQSYPSLVTNTLAMDVIFCRNVLMYFSEEGVRQVGRRFSESLTDRGWLILSPSEASSRFFPELVPVNFPGAIFFQKKLPSLQEKPVQEDFSAPHALGEAPETQDQADESQVFAARDDVAQFPDNESGSASLLAKAKVRFGEGYFAEAAKILRDYLQLEPRDRAARNLAVRALANAGELPGALNECQEALEGDRLDGTFHYLQAHILQEMGRTEEAIRAMQGAIFLEPEFAMAHFALGNLLRQAGRSIEARRHLRRAHQLLSKLPPHARPPEGEALTAARIQQIITASLRALT